jgi:hypothetical protein|uniref:Uncharacterized protein n=1 Tax=viral metagenome TaxID=1070528 RepID=A0A6C0BLY0_9ZZZZ
METSCWIIHVGRQTSSHSYDHQINLNQWPKFMSLMTQNQGHTSPFPVDHITPLRFVTKYCLGSLTYEVDSQTGEVIACYLDTVSDLNQFKIDNALTYQRHRKSCQMPFQPVNNYYNRETLERVVVSFRSNILRLERGFQPEHGEIIFEMCNCDELEKYREIIQQITTKFSLGD